MKCMITAARSFQKCGRKVAFLTASSGGWRGKENRHLRQFLKGKYSIEWIIKSAINVLYYSLRGRGLVLRASSGLCVVWCGSSNKSGLYANVCLAEDTQKCQNINKVATGDHLIYTSANGVQLLCW